MRSLASYQALDLLALEHARKLHRRLHAVRCGGVTQTWTELLYANTSDFGAYASSAVEGSLLTPGPKTQPVIPATYFEKTIGRSISIVARGVLSVTGTPTIIFQARLGTTQGSTFLSGTSVGVSAAITTIVGVTNKWWELRLDLTCDTIGQGTGNTILSGSGYVASPGGFASPFVYPLEPTTPDTATWTATIDDAITQYLNLSATWSANSASNTITVKQLLAYGLN